MPSRGRFLERNLRLCQYHWRTTFLCLIKPTMPPITIIKLKSCAPGLSSYPPYTNTKTPNIIKTIKPRILIFFMRKFISKNHFNSSLLRLGDPVSILLSAKPGGIRLFFCGLDKHFIFPCLISKSFPPHYQKQLLKNP